MPTSINPLCGQNKPDYGRDLPAVEGSPRQSLGLRIPWLHNFIEVLLEVREVIRDETECVVQSKPLDVGWVLGEIGTLAIEFGEDGFDLHALKGTGQRLRCSQTAHANPHFTPPVRFPQRHHVSR